jgi:vacuolar-type H+-ATPase subunit I/STV1
MYSSESVRRAATAGLALMAVFPVTVAILNLVQRGHYNPATDAISLLALGRGGLALNVAFITGGAVSFIMAWVLRRTVADAVAGPLLVAFFGCTSVVSGLVDTNPDNAPNTAASNVHQLAGILGFLAVIAAMFVFARRFRKDPVWRDFARPTLLWAIAAAVTFLCVPAAPASLFGVAQYAHVATWMSWGLVTMVRARSLAATHAPAGQELRHPELSQEATLNTVGDA